MKRGVEAIAGYRKEAEMVGTFGDLADRTRCPRAGSDLPADRKVAAAAHLRTQDRLRTGELAINPR
jgi:hypothetical protein